MSYRKYPGYKSLFFNNLDTSQGKRMDAGCYRHITNKVASLYGKVSPRGCSQNTRVYYEDIDRAQNDMKSKEKVLQKFTELELSKLNTPILKLPITNFHRKKVRFCDPENKKEILGKVQPGGHKRFKTADNVIDQCTLFQPELTPQKKELAKQSYFRMNTSHKAVNYIKDLSECLKTSQDEEKIKNMMSTLKYNRKVDFFLKGNIGNTKQEMLETTDKLAKMGKGKLWRQNNIALISETDRLLKSIPITKS